MPRGDQKTGNKEKSIAKQEETSHNKKTQPILPLSERNKTVFGYSKGVVNVKVNTQHRGKSQKKRNAVKTISNKVSFLFHTPKGLNLAWKSQSAK